MVGGCSGTLTCGQNAFTPPVSVEESSTVAYSQYRCPWSPTSSLSMSSLSVRRIRKDSALKTSRVSPDEREAKGRGE